MDKDERLKFVNENGETILMTKSEYLKLAKQKGWNVKIPRLTDGTCDCDVFGGDNVILEIFDDISISGNFSLGNSAKIFSLAPSLAAHVSAGDSIYLGASVLVGNLSAKNNITIGHGSGPSHVFAGNNVTIGNNVSAFSIHCGGTLIAGNDLFVNVPNKGIFAGGDIYIKNGLGVSGNISAFGSIHIGKELSVTNVSNYEGSVTIGAEAIINVLSSENGDIRIGSNSKIKVISAFSGNVCLKDNCTIGMFRCSGKFSTGVHCNLTGCP